MLNNYQDGIDYANKIVNRDVVAGKWIRLACERFLADLENTSAKFYFDKNKAQKVCSFFEDLVKHVKGPLAGQPYKLSDWEIFILINIYGFVMKDNPNIRRFKDWLEFVARKNSKSTKTSGAVIYHLLAENEEGLEAYSIATQRDQAKICWEAAERMITKMPQDAQAMFKTANSTISIPKLFNKYKPLGRDSKGLDGLNPSFALFDEAAKIRDRNMFEVITSGQGARPNRLNIYITTAQTTKDTVFYENYEYCKKILTGEIKDDNWFAAIYELDEGDAWNDESVWIKANPNLGKSVSLEDLRDKAKMAQEITAKRNDFLIKNMNVWTSSSEAWLPSEFWSKNAIKEIDRSGPLWVGVDLGSTSDLTALTFLFKNGDEYHMESQCFLPEETMKIIPRHLKETYSKAVSSGILSLTPGNATDYNIVKEFLLDYTKDKDLKEIAYDPWSAQKVMTELTEEGAPTIAVRQGISHLSPATKDTDVHIRKSEIKHTGNPFLQWQFENCTVFTDINGNMKVRKGEDRNLKIDAIIALIIAISRASSQGGLNNGSFFVYSG